MDKVPTTKEENNKTKIEKHKHHARRKHRKAKDLEK